MADGFGAVPDELRQMADRIDRAVAGAVDLAWAGPSGDFGHPGVQAGWSRFLDDVKELVDRLRVTASEHGEGLRTAADRYRDMDIQSGNALGGLGESSGIPGGGWAGGVAGVGENPPAEGGPSGFIDPKRINPDFDDDNGQGGAY